MGPCTIRLQSTALHRLTRFSQDCDSFIVQRHPLYISTLHATISSLLRNGHHFRLLMLDATLDMVFEPFQRRVEAEDAC